MKIILTFFSCFILFVYCDKNKNPISSQKNPNLYITIDSTLYWEQTNLDSVRITALTINSHGHIFAGKAGSPTSNNKIYRSVDAGKTWELSSIPGDKSYIDFLAVNSLDEIYASSYNGQISNLFYSKDNGITWQSMNTPYGLKINAIDFNSLNHIYICSSRSDETHSGIYFSSNYGLNWNEVKWFSNQESVYFINFSHNNELFTASVRGIHKTIDNGNNWIQLSKDLDDDHFISICLKTDDIFFASTWENGIYRSVDAGKTWEQTALHDLHSGTIKVNSIGYVFVGDNRRYSFGKSNGFYYSTDNGVNWIQINEGLKSLNVNNIYINNQDIIYAGIGNNGIYKSIKPFKQ